MEKESNNNMYDLFVDTQELLDISKDNMIKILERDVKLTNLEHTSSQLAISAETFKERCTLPWYKKYSNYFVGGGIGITTVALIKVGCILLL